MTDKDPKDMTASELVRWVENYTDIMCRACREMGFGCDAAEVGDCEKALDFIADKIDAELAEARKDAIRESKKPMWWFRSAIKRGEDWPEPRDGEKFRDYLHRCFLPRPRFEDGEVVGVREYEDIQGYCVYDDGEFFVTTPNRSIDYAAGERVERPAPEALGADGLPIREGETVWDVYGSGPAEVYRIGPADDEDGPVVWDIEGNYTMPYLLTHERPVLGADGLPLKVGECVYGVGSRFKKFPIVSVHKAGDTIDGFPAELDFVRYEDGYDWAKDLTHTPPDTQEQIDRDAALPAREYYARHIGHDVAEKGAVEVHAAVTAHLLKRQRAIDAKGAI